MLPASGTKRRGAEHVAVGRCVILLKAEPELHYPRTASERVGRRSAERWPGRADVRLLWQRCVAPLPLWQRRHHGTSRRAA
jgi:hypothetical protein